MTEYGVHLHGWLIVAILKFCIGEIYASNDSLYTTGGVNWHNVEESSKPE